MRSHNELVLFPSRRLTRNGRSEYRGRHPAGRGELVIGRDPLSFGNVQRRGLQLRAAQRARLILENHALHARVIKFSWRGRRWD